MSGERERERASGVREGGERASGRVRARGEGRERERGSDGRVKGRENQGGSNGEEGCSGRERAREEP